jgi:polyhydroxyalkanoate synthesis regulator phasin
MDESIKKMVKTGFGLGLLTLDQAKKVVSKARKELNLNDAESRKLAKELVSSSEKAAKDVLKVAGKHFDTALVNTGLIKKRELARVKKVVKRRVKNKLSGKKSVVERIKKKVRRR